MCVCVFSCVYTHPKDKDGWKLPVLLCVTLVLLHSIFVRGSNSELRGLFCLNCGGKNTSFCVEHLTRLDIYSGAESQTEQSQRRFVNSLT